MHEDELSLQEVVKAKGVNDRIVTRRTANVVCVLEAKTAGSGHKIQSLQFLLN